MEVMRQRVNEGTIEISPLLPHYSISLLTAQLTEHANLGTLNLPSV